MLSVIQELKVKKIIIGKQFENCENYEKFMNIVRQNHISVMVVEAGQKINIEKHLYFHVLWPTSQDKIDENVLNNNSLVCRLLYKKFSMLFTGDMEEIAEKEILRVYKNTSMIGKTTILKVAHHRLKDIFYTRIFD